MSLETNTKAKIFADLHKKNELFILANAWDAASARIFEKAGFPAIGTTSAGIAASRGYRDGQNIPLSEMLESIEQIVSAVNIPVSADIEAGFGESPEEIVATIKKVSSLGAVGINIEDGTGNKAHPIAEIATQTKKIRAIRKEPSLKNLWINARIDLFYLGLLGMEEAIQETIHRAQAYLEAGADSIFIFAVNNKDIISTLTHEIKGPLNVLAGPHMPTIKELKELGVVRVSLGSAPMRATLGLLEEISTELLTLGTYHSLTNKAVPYPNLQELFSEDLAPNPKR